MGKLLVVRFPKEQVAALNTYLDCQRNLPYDVREAQKTLRSASRSEEVEERIDWDSYDFSRFIRRVYHLGRRMNYIAIGFLVRSALNEKNCGVEQLDNRRQLVERAIDLGIVHTEQVDGDHSPNKITSVKLNEEHPEVQKVLNRLPKGST